MAIHVTCPGCHVRFNVSEKFAGREGPCPKCKAPIKIPAKNEEVVIHAPVIGPKDTKGRPVLRPIVRGETNLSSVQITLIVAVIALFMISALIFRFFYPTASQSNALQEIVGWAAVVLLAVPCFFAAYTFLRDQEKGAYYGKELWARVAIGGFIYALTWASMWVSHYAFNGNWGPATWFVAGAAMLAMGGAVGMICLDLDYLSGLLHYGMYFGCCVLTRLAAGVGIFPGWIETYKNTSTGTGSTAISVFLCVDPIRMLL